MLQKSTGFSLSILIAVLVLVPLSQALAQRPTDEGITVDEAQMSAAKTAQAKHQKSLLKQPGVHGVGIGLMEDGKRVGIHVFVDKGKSKEVPKELDGVPVKVIETGRFKKHNGPCADPDFPCHFQAVALPVQMGNSTSNVNLPPFAGTMGFRVMRKGDSSVVGYVTANHIAAASGPDLCPAQINPEVLASFGTDQCQPGRLDGGGNCIDPPIGDLVQVVPLVMGEDYFNTVDAAFVRSNRGCVSKVIRDIGAPGSKPALPKLNSILLLSGRSSGLRAVQVLAINVTVSVDYDSACGTALFVNQIITVPTGSSSSASLPGDSGAPVVTTKKAPVGLNFAGGDVFGVVQPITPVLEALQVSIDTLADAPPASSCTE